MDDAESLARHADNRAIWRNLLDGFPNPYTKDDARAFLETRVGQEPVTNLAIEVLGEAAGSVGIHMQGDVGRRSAEIGYWLGQAHWGRGIMTEAVAR